MAAWNSGCGNQCEGMRVAQPAVPFRGVIPAIGSPCGVRDDFDEDSFSRLASWLMQEQVREYALCWAQQSISGIGMPLSSL